VLALGLHARRGLPFDWQVLGKSCANRGHRLFRGARSAHTGAATDHGTLRGVPDRTGVTTSVASHNTITGRFDEAWAARDMDAMMSAAARAGSGQAGEWGPPDGVEPIASVLALNIGIPDAASLPRAAMAAALDRVLARADDLALRYDMGAGHLAVREYLADKLSRERGLPVDAAWFQICNGSSGAIDMVVRALIDPGDVIIAEAPTYLGTLRNFRGVLADVRSVPTDADGLCVDALAELVRRCRAEGRRVKLVYTVAAFQNPTGRTLSASRRVALLELGAREGFFVLDDDVYGDLYYDAPSAGSPPPPALSALGGGHGVITVGSFSKVLATGLRIGFVHARPELLARLGRMRFEMGNNPLALHMLAELARSGELDAHVQAVRALYKDKMARLSSALERAGSRHLRFVRPHGGFYLWPELLGGLDAERVWRAAYRQGVSVNPGFAFFADKRDPTGEHLRLAFSWVPAERLDEAAQRLLQACDRVAAGDEA